MYTLTLDPGVRTAGLCVWDTEMLKGKLVHAPLEARAFSVASGGQYVSQVQKLVREMIEWMDESDVGPIDGCLSEEPRLFSGSALSQSATAQGHIPNMMFMMGYFCHLLHIVNAEFATVSVSDWKGNMPKNMTHTRIARVFEQHGVLDKALEVLSGSYSHDWDACGIGLWAMGEL